MVLGEEADTDIECDPKPYDSKSCETPVTLPIHELPVNIAYLSPVEVCAAEYLGYDLAQEACQWTSATSLKNVGNTCYLNALLHALASLPQVRVWVRQHQAACTNGCVLCDLAEDVECMTSSEGFCDYVPQIVRHRASWSSNQFAGTEQQDASEAYTLLADACNEVDHKAVLNLGIESAKKINSRIPSRTRRQCGRLSVASCTVRCAAKCAKARHKDTIHLIFGRFTSEMSTRGLKS